MRHRTVRELMTSPAVCARLEWTVAEAVRVMQEHRVKRLPVVSEAERLVGIVSRSDLLRVFLRRDHAIRAEIVKDVVAKTLGESPSVVGVSVEGVVSVDQRLGWDEDDTGRVRTARQEQTEPTLRGSGPP